jgi:hypothetical protein
MKILLLLFLALSPVTFLTKANHLNDFPQEKSNTVYICEGPKSERYHRIPNCSGLNNCSTEIHSVHVSHAVRIGRTPCRVCY